ncbi:MAG: Zn-dependent hydrolase [Alphaproteobacteria bacterium]|nr:Zn-dependent hydrolase [Alphaproteobacteria bacterium]
MENLRIDGDRLWSSLMEMAKIGATAKGGVCRLAATDLDRQGRDLFAQWCREAGCTVKVDAIGNMFARRPGRNPALPPVMTGSHLDTQPTGGRFDGVYGVLAGLEVIRTLNDADYATEASIEVVVWTNEEGSRFSPAMVGSGVHAGVFDLAYGLERPDNNDTTKSLGGELAAIGYAGPEPVGGRPAKAYFEAHIEQGPILEDERKVIGVVTGAQGQRWYEITVTGQEAHAGPTPMKKRRDALVASARMIDAVNRIGLANQPNACATVGFVRVSPNSRNTIPGQVFFTVDFRHPVDAVLTKMDQELRAACAEHAAATGTEANVKEFWYFPPTPFDTACVAAVRDAAAQAGLPHMDIVSGAGHDAVYMAKVAPTGMIFVPCADGISHNEVEDAKPTDIAAGCEVLLHAVIRAANA